MKFQNLLNDFIDLFYPVQCVACGCLLVDGEKTICIECLCGLPRTNFHFDHDNEVARMFWGRVELQQATAYLYFNKGGKVQAILHKLKYKNQKRIGFDIGCLVGSELKHSPFNDIDLIIPIPLHRSKYRKRGYNQSELIALGLAEGMGKPVDTHTLYRAIANPTQTKKQRYDRWTNVKGIFAIRKEESIVNKHILLVDDVITTGATLEAGASALLGIENVKVSVFALAKA